LNIGHAAPGKFVTLGVAFLKKPWDNSQRRESCIRPIFREQLPFYEERGFCERSSCYGSMWRIYLCSGFLKDGNAPKENKEIYSAPDIGCINQNADLYCAFGGLAIVARGSIEYANTCEDDKIAT